MCSESTLVLFVCVYRSVVVIVVVVVVIVVVVIVVVVVVVVVVFLNTSCVRSCDSNIMAIHDV